jgi:hypothetical protein
VRIKKDENEDFKDVYRFGEHQMMIPFEKLNVQSNLEEIDLTKFQGKCRDILKQIYDTRFKTHKTFKELKDLLTQDELQNKILQQVFLNGVSTNHN